ncbi:filamentous hemagglutinin N-terminal domain-containing protein [Marinagarivorans cellulosilyticus]|uniref:Filamentous haemagglutinin FhaB/tRNA nuclease CdiA-like TPS domain-containing protein n=1 Tax=Marinagarivorans cellulosilyticus TaxID=2721545 RepID=A0AAN2BKB4_9GAMM|nr:filamentous hemagglutinin N-terminal domain-containing protein [Marinagarivorans cellulosilyticus]BCD97831.1 hypothetical protein MARGE09_P2032 [Marinagarivorans cellulosilyticus]
MGKFCSKSAGIKLRRRLYLAVLAASSGSAFALPQGGQVSAGDASIENAGDTMNIHQDSQRVVLDFDSYNVAAGETVNYQQPNSDSVALNRVLGSELSEIHGSINANGHVYLINPNGVLFGEGAQVNVTGLVATTLDIDNQDFMQQREHFSGEQAGSVDNQGNINARDRVVLMAPEVLNSGDIQVPAGEIMLRSGNSVLLHTAGSEIPILVEDPQLDGHVSNVGSLSANRVALVLDGQQGRDVYDSAINNHGLVRAVSVAGEGGSIELLAGSSDVVNTGRLDASATDGQGGAVNIEAHRYAQTGELNASGANIGDGGAVNIHAADTIVFHADSESRVDGGAEGNGGEMIAYADNATWYREGSQISARGGDVLGDGGFVEVSGRNVVAVESPVDIGATNGKGGLWYIDPTDITVTDATGNTNGAFTMGGDGYIFNLTLPAQATSIANRMALQNTLVNFGSVYLDTASDAAGTGDIIFEATVDFIGAPAGRVMSLRADNDIIFRDGAGFTHTNNGNWSLNLDMNAGDSITFESGSVVAFRNGSVNATAVNDFSLLGDASISGDGAININAGHDIVMGADSQLNAGAFPVNLTGGNHVTVADIVSLNTTENAISITATAGEILDDTNAANGLHANSGGIFLQAVNGIDSIALETTQLGVRNSSGDVALSTSGDLSLNRLGLGANMTMSISAGGSLTYVGDAGNDFDGATASTLNLTSGTEMVINGRIVDETGSSDHELDINLVAGTDLSMLDGSILSSGFGVFDVQALNGDATVTGLNTQAMVNNAITVSALNGQILDGGDTRTDLYAPDGGFFLRSMGDIVGLESETNTFDAISTAGNIELSDVASFAAERLEAGGAVTINATNGFAIRNSAIVNATDLTVNASQLIRLPNTELRVTGTMTLNGSDIRQQDGLREVDLAANTLVLNSDFEGGDATINADAQFLELRNTGADTVTVINSSDLSLTQYEATTGSSVIQTASGFDLTVANAINLEGNAAALTLNAGNDLFINADIADVTGAVDNSTQLSLLADGNILQSALTTSNAGAGNMALNAGDNINLASVIGAAVDITAAGDITDANTAALNITAPSINLVAGGNVGTNTDAIENSSSALTLTAGNAFIHNDGALALTIAAVDNINVTLAAGDLTLLDSLPTITGSSTFNVVAGDLIIPDAGWTTSGNLMLTAQDLVDSDRAVAIDADQADITLTAMADDLTISSGFNQLNLDAQASTNRLTLTNSRALTLNGVSTNGAANISTVAANLTVAPTTLDIAGDLALSTIGSGDVIIGDAGFSHASTFNLTADNLRDTDNDITLAAPNANIILRDGAADKIWNTSFNSLGTNVAGAGGLAINNSNALVLNTLTTGGAASVATAAGDLTLVVNPAVAGDLQLVANENLVIPTAGLNHSDNLTLQAAQILDDDNTVSITANNLSISQDSAAADAILNIDADTLSFASSGLNPVVINAQNNILVSDLAVAGDATLTSAGDITLGQNVTVPGLLDVQTTGTGLLQIADTGLNVEGDVRLDVASLQDGDQDIILSANSADITLRNQLQALTLNSDLSQLRYSQTTGSALVLQQSGDLTVNRLDTGGNVDIVADSSITFNQSNPVLTGDLLLQVADTLTVSNAGLNLVANLTLDANTVANAAGVGITRWQADTINFNANNIQSNALILAANDVNITYGGINALSVNLPSATAISALTSAADTSLIGASDLQFLTTATSVNGLLDVQALGSIELLEAGLNVANVSMEANNLTSTGGGVIRLIGDSAALTLGGEQALALETQLATLALDYAAENALSINNTGDLWLTDWQAANATNTALAATGVLRIPESGLAANSRLSVSASDFTDSDRTLNFSAPELLVNLSNAQGENTWQLDGGIVDAQINGAASLQIFSNGALGVQDLNGDAQAIHIADGNFSLYVNDGDLSVDGNITASDIANDGLRNGIIDLVADNGNILVGQSDNAAITSRYNINGLGSTNRRDSGAEDGISLRLTDNTANERQIVLGNGSTAVALQAVGSDIALNAWPVDTSEDAVRHVVQAQGVQIEAYNNPTDSQTGQVLVNGVVVAAQPWQQIREGRTLTITTDKPAKLYDIDDVLAEMPDADDSVIVEEEIQASGENVAHQFDAVFGGSCTDIDDDSVKRCRIDTALKAFLSHWLVGGELPPTSEM